MQDFEGVREDKEGKDEKEERSWGEEGGRK
jgi:hypothetical protein